MTFPLSSAQTPVYIAATGIVTALGSGTSANLAALRSGTSGIGKARVFTSRWTDEIPVAEIPLQTEQLSAQAGLPAGWPRTAVLSALAVGEILERMGTYPRGEIAFLSANTVGGMDKTEAVYHDILLQPGSVPPGHYRAHECGAVTNLVKDHFGLGGFTTTISTACSSSANSIMLAAQLIRAGIVKVAIAGGADALSRFTLNGFNSLGILDREACQPLDNNRRGLNLGEGAGYVLLAGNEGLRDLQMKPLALLSGWANSNDAWHQTASSPEGRGNTLAMEGALRIAGLQPAEVSAINLHGTGTANNDSAESRAVENVFGTALPPCTSTKSFTGHTLGAAAGVEAVFSVLALQHQELPPTLRWTTPMEDTILRPVTALTPLAIRHILSNSFGFGGNCSSLLFSAAQT